MRERKSQIEREGVFWFKKGKVISLKQTQKGGYKFSVEETGPHFSLNLTCIKMIPCLKRPHKFNTDYCGLFSNS